MTGHCRNRLPYREPEYGAATAGGVAQPATPTVSHEAGAGIGGPLAAGATGAGLGAGTGAESRREPYEREREGYGGPAAGAGLGAGYAGGQPARREGMAERAEHKMGRVHK